MAAGRAKRKKKENEKKTERRHTKKRKIASTERSKPRPFPKRKKSGEKLRQQAEQDKRLTGGLSIRGLAYLLLLLLFMRSPLSSLPPRPFFLAPSNLLPGRRSRSVRDKEEEKKRIERKEATARGTKKKDGKERRGECKKEDEILPFFFLYA